MQKPRICIDGRMLAARATGVATYARTVVAALEATGSPPEILDDDARGRFGERASLAAGAVRWIKARGHRPVVLAMEPGGLHARDVFRRAQARFEASGRLLALHAPGPPGVIHWTYPIAARIEGWANLYTVHDVIPITDPTLSPVAADGLARRVGAIVEAGGGLLTVSGTSRHAIARAFGLDVAAIANTGLAVPPSCRGRLPEALVPGGYHLFLGSAEPRKNLSRVLAGWQGAARLPLAIAGHDAPDLPAGAIGLGHLARPALDAAIANARSIVFPTLAEGFGLPIVEGMAAGVPVITSDLPVTRETAGDAALLVDPLDAGAIGWALAGLEADEALRADLIARGRARASAFSLEAFGGRLRRLYAEKAGALGSAP